VAPGADAYARIAGAAQHQIKSMIGITTNVLVKKPGDIPRSMGKAVRVRDLRPKAP
jgi:phenylacetate-CoA ligase